MDAVITECEYTAAPLAEVVGRANRAAVTVERACGILAEDAKRAEALVAYKRARELAALTARANRAGQDALAERASAECERVAAEVVAFDKARLSGINPDEAWTEPGADDGEILDAEFVAAKGGTCHCGPTPQPASAARYKKGKCRCDAGREAKRAAQRRNRAAG